MHAHTHATHAHMLAPLTHTYILMHIKIPEHNPHVCVHTQAHTVCHSYCFKYFSQCGDNLAG